MASGAVPVAGLDERRPEVRQDAEPQRVVGSEQRARPREEVDRGRVVAAGERLFARGREAPPGGVGELPLAFARRSELEPVPVRLLQVIADDLVLLAERSAGPSSHVREPLVQVRARGLRDRVVRGVADQQVAERERVGRGQVGALGPDELLADERARCRRPTSSARRPRARARRAG